VLQLQEVIKDLCFGCVFLELQNEMHGLLLFDGFSLLCSFLFYLCNKKPKEKKNTVVSFGL